MWCAKSFFLCDHRSRWWTCCCTIFTCAMSFKILDKLENLIPVWKCVDIEFLYVCLNNLDRLSFIICLHTKDLLLHGPRRIHYIWLNKYFPAIIWKEKENKVNRDDLSDCYFVSIIVKHCEHMINKIHAILYCKNGKCHAFPKNCVIWWDFKFHWFLTILLQLTLMC